MNLNFCYILLDALVVFAGVIIGVVIANFVNSKLCEKPNLYHFYVTYILVNSKGKRIYQHDTISFQNRYPSEDDIAKLREDKLLSNADYKECEIMSVVRLGVRNSGCNTDS